MFNTMAGPSLADIAAVTGNRNNDGGFGDGNGWWVLIILFALFGGWGGNSYGAGNQGNANSQFTDAALQRGFDQQTVITKLDGINSGICSLGYDQLAQMNGINTNIMQTGFGLQQGLNNNAIANMQQFNALSNQFQQCCCDQRAAVQDLKYDMATSDCSIKTLMNQLFQQLQWGQMNGIRDLTDLITQKFCDLEMSQKDQTIADLRMRLGNCDRDGALQALYTQLVNYLNPRAVPAYPACNPNGIGNWSPNVLSGGSYNGYNNGCGCTQMNGCCA